MGRVHSNAYRQVSQFFTLAHKPVLKAACGRNKDKIQAFADNWGYESIETDWRKLVERKDIDAIDICAPNNTHHDIAIAAAQSGKWVMCEKPIGMTVDQGREMVEAVKKAGVPNLVWYNYRRVPAIALMRQIIDEGRLGKIFHFRSDFLQDWTISADVPIGGDALWRLEKESAGAGVSGDLISHNIDTARYLNGAFASVCGMTEIFVKERPLASDPSKKVKVELDDSCAFLARFANGSNGTFEATRYARGHKARKAVEVNGEKGSVYFNLEDMNHLQFFDHGDPSHLRGWRSIHVSNGEHPYMGHYWVPGLEIGYEHSFINTVADFLQGVESGKPANPTFEDALQTTIVQEAVLESAAQRKWVDIP
jgi:predicted dehydrogenase